MKESTTYSESIIHIAIYEFFQKLRHTYIKAKFHTVPRNNIARVLKEESHAVVSKNYPWWCNEWM